MKINFKNVKGTIYILLSAREDNRENGEELLVKEPITKYLPSLNLESQIQEARRVSKKTDPKRKTQNN